MESDNKTNGHTPDTIIEPAQTLTLTFDSQTGKFDISGNVLHNEMMAYAMLGKGMATLDAHYAAIAKAVANKKPIFPWNRK